MSNLAMIQDRDAVVVPFPKQGQQTMSDRFTKGFVAVSRLYLSDVRPFLSPAAKDVYEELNARITGFGKESDHVSYSQLQGGELEGSKKTSPATIRKGIKELVDLGVISIVSEHARKGNEYRINEVSLVEHFKNKSTTSKNEALQKLKCEDFKKCSASTSKIEDTIDNFIDIKNEEEGACEKIEPVQQQEKINPSQFFVEYKNEDWTSCSFKQVTEKYPSAIQDFISQGEAIFTDLSKTEILEELKKMSTWSVSAFKRTPQKWMVVWLNTFLPQVRERKIAEQRRIAEQQAEKHKPSPMDVNARYADQIAENKLDPNFVPTLILGEEFG